jgi:hypothetical protein
MKFRSCDNHLAAAWCVCEKRMPFIGECDRKAWGPVRRQALCEGEQGHPQRVLRTAEFAAVISVGIKSQKSALACMLNQTFIAKRASASPFQHTSTPFRFSGTTLLMHGHTSFASKGLCRCLQGDVAHASSSWSPGGTVDPYIRT